MKAQEIFNVCSFFVGKGIQTDRPITQIKLQKLLYFAQGVYLAMHGGEELFSNKIYAWMYGPVAREVYHYFKIFGNNPIVPSGLDTLTEEGAELFIHRRDMLKTYTVEFLESVWAVFGKYSAFELVGLTHMPGSPWFQIFQQYEGDIPKDVEIPKGMMEEYFRMNIELRG